MRYKGIYERSIEETRKEMVRLANEQAKTPDPTEEDLDDPRNRVSIIEDEGTGLWSARVAEINLGNFATQKAAECAVADYLNAD